MSRSFGPRRLMSASGRVIRVVCGDRFCDNKRTGERCPQADRPGGCPAAVRIAGSQKRGPDCLQGERRHRQFAGIEVRAL